MNPAKTLLLITLSLLLFSCKTKQDEQEFKPRYTISGHLIGFPEGTTFTLHNLTTMSDIDSAQLKNERIIMEGHIPDTPEVFWLRAFVDDRMIYTPIFIQNDNLEVRADIEDFPWKVKTSGSVIDDEFRKLQGLNQDLDIRMDSIIQVYSELSPEEQKVQEKQLFDDLARVGGKRSEVNLEYIKTTNDTYTSILQLTYYLNDLPKDTVRTIFNRYTKELKSSKYGQEISLYLETSHSQIGDNYYDFEALDQNNNQVRLSHLMTENKYLLLNYTSGYCGHCIRAVDELRSVFKTHNDKMNIVSFSSDNEKEDWLVSVEREESLWPSLWDGKGYSSEIALRYNFKSTPTFLLINPEGIIIERLTGYKEGELEAVLEKRFGANEPVQEVDQKLTNAL